jgi:hypothetical protein
MTAPYLPFFGDDHRLRMGLNVLEPKDWIEFGDDFEAQLAEKRRLFETRHDDIFAALPEAADAASELLALLHDHLTAQHGARYEVQGDQLLNKASGESWTAEPPSRHPLEIAGRLVQEDFCLLQPAGTTHRLVAASLCFPSRWRLAEKLGHGLDVIHGPVPGYAERLQTPVDRFLGLLQPDKPVWRLNWFIHDDPSLFQPARSPSIRPIDAETAGTHLWLRVERQTLRRLPKSGAIVFTIRTHLTPLAQALRTKEQTAELAALIRTMPADMRAYRQMESFDAPLLAWLESRI